MWTFAAAVAFSALMIVVGAWLWWRRTPFGVTPRWYARRVELPLGTPAIERAVDRRIRSAARVMGIALIVAGIVDLVMALMLGRDHPDLFLGLAMALLVIASAAAQLGAAVQGVFMGPLTPSATRIARVRSLRAHDYLGPTRRWLWVVLVVIGVGPTVWHGVALAAGGGALTTLDLIGAVAAVLAVVGAVVLPSLDRVVLAQAQPATHTLELAWDDVVRTEALGALRAPLALLGWLASAAAIGGEAGSAMFGAAIAGQLTLFVYGPHPLRPALRPVWMSRDVETVGVSR